MKINQKQLLMLMHILRDVVCISPNDERLINFTYSHEMRFKLFEEIYNQQSEELIEIKPLDEEMEYDNE